MKKFALLMIVVGILVLGAMMARQTAQPIPPQQTDVLDETSAEIGDLRLTVSATGAVTPRRQVALLFESSGIVSQVMFKAGDAVLAGEPLAQLDTSDLDAALSDAEVRLEMQQIAYDALTSPPTDTDLAAAQAAVNAAQAALNAA